MKLFLFTLLLGLNTYAQEPVLDENFENGIPSSWTIQKSNNETWKTQDGYDYFYTNVAVVDSSPDPQDEWLITPSMNFTNVISPQLHFIAATSHRFAVQFNIFDLNVHVSTDGGNSWNLLWNDNEMPWEANYVPFLTSIDLHEYIGKPDVKIAFQYKGTDGTSFLIDRVWLNTKSDYCLYFFPDDKIEPITRVAIANLEHTASPIANAQESHLFIFDKKAEVEIGHTYTLELEGITASTGMSKFVLFLDWNHDGLLSYDDEMYEIGKIENSSGTDGVKVSKDITIPKDAKLGDTRMRIVKINTDGYPEACDSNLYENGQAKDFILAISENLSQNDLSLVTSKIYPNPVKDILNVDYHDKISIITIKDINGRVVHTQSFNQSKVSLDLTTLPIGVYIMTITSKNKTSVHKILKK